MQHRISFSTDELVVIREAIHRLTITGKDAFVVGQVLQKIYKGIEKAAVEQQESAADEKS